MKKKIRYSLILVLASLVILMSGHLYYHLTGDFQIEYLMKSGEQNPESIAPPENIHEILNQTFFYLGHGNQVYAFLSKDNRYVLKLFKKDFFIRSPIIHIFPPISPFRQFLLYEGTSKKNRTDKLLNGYRTAYIYDKDNSGLIYYHPSKTKNNTLVTEISKKFGSPETINLSEYVFAIQVKGITTENLLNELLMKNKIKEVKARIHQLINLYFSAFKNDIYDHDHNILDNTGFTGSRAIRLDNGKIVREPDQINQLFIEKEMEKIIEGRLRPWLLKYYPQYSEELTEDAKHQVKKRINF